MLLSTVAVEVAIEILTPGDFYKPGHGTIFDSITRLWDNGDPIDAVTVSEDLRARHLLDSIGGSATLVTLQTYTPATTTAPKYARILAELSQRRALLAHANDLAERCYESDMDSGELLDYTINAAKSIDSGSLVEVPAGLQMLTDFLDRPEELHKPWVIEGMLREGWRVVIVAAEGSGKTVLLRHIGVAASQGIHPLMHRPIEPVRTLIVDLENPDESIDEVCAPLIEEARRSSLEFNPDNLWLWHQPAGIDLRNRKDRSTFEAVLRQARPQLVCIGPVYKMYRKGRDDDETAAGETQNVLDDMRVRHKFALLMEHHVPKKQGHGKRELVPHGTALWMRWPELGLGLEPIDGDVTNMEVARFRGDRVKNQWPDRIEHSTPWPWSGVWPTGTFTSKREVPHLHPIAEHEPDLDDEPIF